MDGVTPEDARNISFPDQLFRVYWRNADGFRWIKRGSIAEIYDDAFHTAVTLWKRWKQFGLPHGNGWLNERPLVVEVIGLVEDERNLYESRKAEETRKKRGDS